MSAPRPARAALSPARWPVRWRLAAVSAGLTFAILVCFALIVGRLAADRLEGDFRDELAGSARELAASVQITPFPGGARLELENPDLDRMVLADDGIVRISDAAGRTLDASPGAPQLGPPSAEVERLGRIEVATAQVAGADALGGPVYVQYARGRGELEATVERLWLLLGLGVVGGTALATLAGLAVAARAMRPIADLTATAREIARTRDPSQRMPEPEADDEVGELARTLEEMLRELDSARAETQAMVAAQREFVADASHELRTPLTSILANLELLAERLERPDADPEDREMVGGALASSQRMRRLVFDLLLLARADAGRTGPVHPCDLGEIAAAALAEARPVAAGHELRFEGNGPVPVEGNPDDLHRLVLNLIENGVRHTPEGSRITVGVKRRDGEAELEVSDDGPGLPPGERDHLFDRFVRADGPADRAGDSGTGLGLAIVKAVASSHGGAVEAGDAPSGGARFTVRLPAGEPG